MATSTAKSSATPDAFDPDMFAPNASDDVPTPGFLERYDAGGLVALVGLEVLFFVWARWAYTLYAAATAVPATA